ncbi:MAG TPA: class I SAM-dependent methyltransferase [Acidimicrobiales bacterium]
MYEEGSVEAYEVLQRARGKDHAAEAAAVAALARRHRPGARTLLDVACGTGLHLAAFVELGFEVAGVDASPAMAAAAAARLPGVPIELGDMRSFHLGRRFDVVTCLFSSIGYATTADELDAAVAAMADHLVDGGVLVVEPWITRADWRSGTLHADAGVSGGVAVGRVSRSWDDGVVTDLEMRYVVTTAARSWSFVEHHRLRLADHDEHVRAFARAGLAVHHDPVGLTDRGLYVGVRSEAGAGNRT